MYLKISWLIIVLICQLSYSQQKSTWGKPTKEELELTIVDFEKDAEAVILYESGDLNITNYGYEIEVYMKIKILSQNGFEHASRKWKFSSKNIHNNVSVDKAQTINYDNGKLSITVIPKKDIITEQFDENTNETTLIFPNVKVGSILEYKFTLRSTNDLYSSPWIFQNHIPTLYSKLDLKNISGYDYLTMVDGLNISKKYAGTKGLKSWEIQNVPSTKTYSFVYNVNDYRDRLSLQYTSNQHAHGVYSSMKNWKDFKTLLNKDLRDAAQKVNFIEIAKKIPDGKTQLETITNCIAYINRNYKWTNSFSIIPKNLKDNLLQTKIAHSTDLNLLLHEILKVKGIDSEFIISSFRSRGKLNTSFPLLARMSATLLLVHLKNESLLIDVATTETNKIRYPDLNYFNQFSVKLKSIGDEFFVLKPALSEFHSTQIMEIKPDKIIYKIKDQYRGYISDEEAKTIILKPNSTNTIYESQTTSIDDWKVFSKIFDLEQINNLIIIENPIAQITKNYEIDAKRNYPIELDFPILVTAQLKIPISAEYSLDLKQFEINVRKFDNELIYSQNYTKKENHYELNWQILINKINYSPNEISQFLDFMNEIKLSNNHTAFIKKL